MWEKVGMARDKKGLQEAISDIKQLRKEFWDDVRVTGGNGEINPELQKATRLADYLELGELMARDALAREESCGGHFRVEFQTQDGEALRNDKDYSFVSAWEFKGLETEPELHKEPLDYQFVEVKQRSYK
jgi:succinate dehydrogenase / fumarate reductase flavoprotein subunit